MDENTLYYLGITLTKSLYLFVCVRERERERVFVCPAWWNIHVLYFLSMNSENIQVVDTAIVIEHVFYLKSIWMTSQYPLVPYKDGRRKDYLLQWKLYTVMFKILNLLGGCKSQNLQSSCCKFCIYTHPVNSKITTWQ